MSHQCSIIDCHQGAEFHLRITQLGPLEKIYGYYCVTHMIEQLDAIAFRIRSRIGIEKP